MTVCIATISEGVVIMVSDRMITSGDIEFEPPSAKVTALTSSIAAMYSGDATLHAEIMQELMVEVRRRIKDDPDDWLKVREMAYLYVRCWTDVKYRRAEIEVLSKYGLNRKTYADQLLTLDPKLVDRISDEISKVRLPSVEVIIAGVDLRFGHAAPSIYHVCDDMVFCADQAAFVAIGTGARHAEAQFMLAKYARSTPNGEALLLAYSAKRDSEVAPGVGKETDVYVIGHQVGASYALGEPLRSKLEAEYQRTLRAKERVVKKARAEVHRYLEQVVNQLPSPQQPPNAMLEGTAPDSKGAKG